jgi:hypothetical protein
MNDPRSWNGIEMVDKSKVTLACGYKGKMKDRKEARGQVSRHITVLV